MVQFPNGAIVWLSPNPKINPNLDQNLNPNWGQLYGYQKNILAATIKYMNKTRQSEQVLSWILPDNYESVS